MAGKKQPARVNPTCSVCSEALSSENWTPSCREARRYICGACWVTRPQRYASKNPDHKEQRRSQERDRKLGWSEERKELERQKSRDRYFKRTYGITLEEYNKRLDEQNGLCRICGTDEPGGKGQFHVDHCHDGGHVRGLLCVNCNLMLGLVHDNIKVLSNAIKYLEAN